METQIGSKQQDSLNTTGSKDYFEVKSIENTPFMLVRSGKNEYSAGIGNSRVTAFYKTEQEVIDKVNQRDWTLITAVIGVMINSEQYIKELFKKS